MRVTSINTHNVCFKSEFDDRVRRIEKNNSFFSKAYWNATSTVEKEMKAEIVDYKERAAKLNGEADGLNLTLNESKCNHAELLKSKTTQLSTVEAALNSDKMLLTNMDKTLATQQSGCQSLDKALESYNQTLGKQKIEHQELLTKMEELKNESADYPAKATKELENILNNAEYKHKQEISELDVALNNAVCAPDEFQETLICYKENGFGAIAGYRDEKLAIRKFFGEALVLNYLGNEAKIPNGVLFYGPDKNRNRDFVKATANQYDCNLIEIGDAKNEDEFIDKIYDSLDLANENYESKNTHSIIFISDFDKKVQPKSLLSETLKSILDDAATENHATIFATSTNPENMDDVLLRDGRFDLKLPIKVKLSYKDFEDYLKYYFDIPLLSKINLDKYTSFFFGLQQEEAFSLSKLKDIFKILVPDFKKSDLINFEKQKSLFKNL